MNGGWRALTGASEGALVIFDCNGVLVDSEPIATAVLAEQFARVGIPTSSEFVARCFIGRRPADIYAAVEHATGKKLPENFRAAVAAATLRRFRTDLQAMPHVARALTWLRGPKAVASSSTLDRIYASLDVTGLLRFFAPRLFSASEVPNGKPAPDLFLHAAARMWVEPADCIVVEDSAPGIAAAAAAGMLPVGYVGGTHAEPELADQLMAAGARTVIADMRELQRTVIELRGW
jgi:HAD superfamily hydrolase (TIGR01509 family)